MPRVKRATRDVSRGRRSFAGRRVLSREIEAVQDRETAGRALPRFRVRDRRARKRDFRRLWIVRINAAARIHEMSYSALMHGSGLQACNSTARSWPTSRSTTHGVRRVVAAARQAAAHA